MSKEEQKELTPGQKRYFRQYINKFLEESKQAISEIEKLKNEIVEGSDSVYSIDEIDGFKKKLAELHDFIIAEDENGETIEDKLITFKESADKESKEILDLKSQIAKYKDQLYGTEDENGKQVPGLVHKIDNMQKQLAQNIEANEKKQQALLEKIEELLQGASTVALAKAFEEHKKQFDKPNKLWLWVFVGALSGLMGLTITAFFVSNRDLTEMWKITLGNLPFIGAGVWLAIYASKQRSQNIRLQQEYAYKEDVAKLYYGLKNEIEQLDNTELGQRLNESVIQILVETVSYNPSKTLDNNSHNDKGPILEALKSISESIKLK
ncbi:MAG: hypothetical protein JJT77_01670 [Crocinitomicaceae bacterium]|nr:hypothetical protein [Crocinitomicaceae bacterium]